jgi:thiamine transport system substrate-binding protein
MLRHLLAFISLALISWQSAYGANPELTIYANDSFLSEWGPGPTLQSKFEQRCKCKIKWVAAADGAALLARLKIEGTRTKADVVIGIDDALTASAQDLGFFMDVDLVAPNTKPQAARAKSASSKKFIPYDYGYYAFMFDTKAKQKNGQPFPRPKNLGELLRAKEFRKSLLIQDPRTSATGLGLLLWLHAVNPKDTEKSLELLREQTLKVSKGWSESYSLFTKGEAPIVLSYTTSEAYHLEIEKQDRYQALVFPEGHYIAYENAAIIKTTNNGLLAKSFLEFLLTEDSQQIIAAKNWMYPVVDFDIALPKAFRTIKKPNKILHIPANVIAANRQAWVEQWTKAFLK